jgi:hypothetical protein
MSGQPTILRLCALYRRSFDLQTRGHIFEPGNRAGATIEAHSGSYKR